MYKQFFIVFLRTLSQLSYCFLASSLFHFIASSTASFHLLFKEISRNIVYVNDIKFINIMRWPGIKIILCRIIRVKSTWNWQYWKKDKLPERIFENFEISRVKRERFQNFQKSWGWYIPRIAWTKHLVTG